MSISIMVINVQGQTLDQNMSISPTFIDTKFSKLLVLIYIPNGSIGEFELLKLDVIITLTLMTSHFILTCN